MCVCVCYKDIVLLGTYFGPGALEHYGERLAFVSTRLIQNNMFEIYAELQQSPSFEIRKVSRIQSLAAGDRVDLNTGYDRNALTKFLSAVSRLRVWAAIDQF